MDSSASTAAITTTTDLSVPANAGEYPGCHLAAYFAFRGVELSRGEAQEVLRTFVRLAELGAIVPVHKAAPASATVSLAVGLDPPLDDATE